MDKMLLIHGDVTFYQADRIPDGLKKIDGKKGFVVEKGEGINTHALENECEIYIDEKNGRMYFKALNEPVKINHREHGLQEVASSTGISYTDLEQEFDWERMERQNTRD